METYSIYIHILGTSSWKKIRGFRVMGHGSWWIFLRWNLGILVVTDGKEHGEHYSHYTL